MEDLKDRCAGLGLDAGCLVVVAGLWKPAGFRFHIAPGQAIAHPADTGQGGEVGEGSLVVFVVALVGLVLAVTLHNLPEGMAVGVVLAGMLTGGSVITVAGAFTLAIGIAIQNFPEGAIISMPLVGSGLSRRKAFSYGFLSGVVEPLGAVLTLLLTAFITPILPYVLSFAAGAMIYVVVEELIPQAQAEPHSNIGTIGAALGFALMMVLDVALG